MATLLTMPAIVADATGALLATWFKTVGETIAVGEPLAEIETEKASVEYESEHAGEIARLLVEEGTNVQVGAPIAVLAHPGDDEAAITKVLTDAGAGTPDVADTEPQAPVSETEPIPDPDQRQRIFSSPLARRLAREKGIDLAHIIGTGPGGRILRSDIEQAAASTQQASSNPAPAAEATAAPAASAQTKSANPQSSTGLPEGAQSIPLTRMRQAIARRLTESKTTVPHFYLAVDVQMDALLELRRDVNAQATRRITVNDLVVKAVAKALIDVPEANACWAGDSITRFRHADVSVAIATETGLVTPVVRAAESLSVSALSATVADYVARAQENRIRPDELSGGSFTVSNLGMFGTKEFSAILNPPQAGILAVGAAEQRPVARDGQLGVATLMTCTLSADHRVVDGAVAARFMAAFKQHLEQPLGLLI